MADEKTVGVLSDEQKAKDLDEALRIGEQMLHENRFDEVVIHLLDVIKRFPESPLPHHNLAVVYLIMLREDYSHLQVWEDLADDETLFQLAVAEEEAALQRDDQFVAARNNLGTLFALRGWWQNAIDQWEQSLSISPDQPEVRQDLTNMRNRLG